MRPKSIATVVVRFCSTPVIWSVPTLARLSGSSVCSGLISLTDPMRVVFPTPNPPDTSTLMPSGTGLPRPGCSLAGASGGRPCRRRSEVAEAMQHRLQHVVGERLGATRWVVHRDEPLLHEVAEQHPDHAE